MHPSWTIPLNEKLYAKCDAVDVFGLVCASHDRNGKISTFALRARTSFNLNDGEVSAQVKRISSGVL